MSNIASRSRRACIFAERQVKHSFKDDDMTATEKLEVWYLLIQRWTFTLAVVPPSILLSRELLSFEWWLHKSVRDTL